MNSPTSPPSLTPPNAESNLDSTPTKTDKPSRSDLFYKLFHTLTEAETTISQIRDLDPSGQDFTSRTKEDQVLLRTLEVLSKCKDAEHENLNLRGETAHLKAAVWRARTELEEEVRRSNNLYNQLQHSYREREEEAFALHQEYAGAARRVYELSTEKENNRQIEAQLRAEIKETRCSNKVLTDKGKYTQKKLKKVRKAHAHSYHSACQNPHLKPNRKPHFHEYNLCRLTTNCFCPNPLEAEPFFVCIGKCDSLKGNLAFDECANKECRKIYPVVNPRNLQTPSNTCYLCDGIDPEYETTSTYTYDYDFTVT